MKVVIAGGTGLIGSALASTLQDRGHQVGIISRDPAGVKPEYQALSWDERALVKELGKADAVINLAGASLAGNNPFQMRWTPKRKAAILSSRLVVGEKLVEAIKELDQPPEVFVQASAIGYYGNQGDQPADEKAPSGDDFLAEICRAWEQSTVEVEEMGLRRLVIRIGLVLSQKGGLLPLLALPFRFFAGGVMGSGDQYLSWIHIQDIVESILYLINDPKHQGVYNLTAPQPATNREFAHHLGQTLRKPVWLPVPAVVLKAALGEASTLALDGRPVYPSRLLNTGYQFAFPDLKDSLEDLFSR